MNPTGSEKRISDNILEGCMIAQPKLNMKMGTAIEAHTDLMGKWNGLAINMTGITKKETHHSNRRVQTRHMAS